MNSSRAANLSLVLVPIGWLFAVYGALSQLGDPAPSVSMSEIETHHRVSSLMLFAGIFALGTALALAGYAVASAPKRCVVAFLGCALPVAAMLLYAVH